MRIHALALLACVLGGLAAPLGAARAENPCAADAKALCPQAVAARDRPAVKACLLRQVPRLSPACRALIAKATPAQPATPASPK